MFITSHFRPLVTGNPLLVLLVLLLIGRTSSQPDVNMSSRQSRSSFLAGFDRIVSNVSSAAQSSKRDQPVEASPSSDDYASRYFAIHVVDEETNRGIPLVYLRTTYKMVYMTDSAGYVAFYEPGLMTGEPLWVTFSSYGFESPTGFLGIAGTQIHPKPGGSVEIRLKRTQVASRLYRMTGYGIYRDSVLLGKPTPIENPVINAKVAGSDTVQCARFQGKLLWMWQDTDQMSFQLGNFSMTGATTDLPERIDPERGLSFDYYTEDSKPESFVRAMVKIKIQKEGSFPIWVDGLTVVLDEAGRERLVARYHAAGHSMECIEEGLVLWDEQKQVFERLKKFDKCNNPLAPSGHTIYVRENGIRYAFYGKNVRVRADLASASDPSQYEAFTCLTPNGQRANRGRDGAPIWSWVKGGRPVNFETADGLVNAGIIRREESPYRLRDVETGQPLLPAQVGIAWNPYLKLWVNIIQQKFGDTTAGEIWFSTAKSPVGPWEQSRKVATHHMARDMYSNNHNDLYNPVQHYELMRAGGRFIYFSGTLVNTFSGNPWWTPYYNYNNIMYRLDLKDTRLGLPQPPRGLWQTDPDDY
ncbi:hypothetical protein M406DRAFT_324979 [Cryphonectria parasitica EP155]|uniref:Uncharacterized protein n=1 Tax=Cryphonectria parasitica (strain ATCC 38755 / EP155) TaxID=660469 RepID=A0A9P4YB87_CRYP1|nr:uncharacterized protein M406DRAFT_324979 [Cryphonectria parasitica EP155]KAF3769470.1 hypothetical protein M406DRAFT_324979 [Cryphonectria parasitica EP155]